MRRNLGSVVAGRRSVGAPADLPAPAAPAGFAPIFAGWNVWDVWQSDDPIEGIGEAIMTAGVSLERQLRIWVEDQLLTVPGVAVRDTEIDLSQLRGDEIQIVSNPAGLLPLVNRNIIPELAGALQLGEEGSKALRRTVRFFNRGVAGVVTWPHDQNYLLETVYAPSSSNPLTNGPAPDTLAGKLDSLGKGATTVGKYLLIGGGVLLVAVLLMNLKKGAVA